MCGNILAVPAVTEREVRHEIPVWWAGRERNVHPAWTVVMGAGATEGDNSVHNVRMATLREKTSKLRNGQEDDCVFSRIHGGERKDPLRPLSFMTY